jgi:molecular chaperone GrpE
MEDPAPINNRSSSAEQLPPPTSAVAYPAGPAQGKEKEVWEGVEQDIQSLLTDMHLLRKDIQAKMDYDESKQRLIESMHKELQEYREGLHFRILKPILLDLISLYDDMGKLIESSSHQVDSFSTRVFHHLFLFRVIVYDEQLQNPMDLPVVDSSSGTHSIYHLKLFQESIEEILQRYDVTSFTVESETFVASKQRILRAVPTDNPELDKKVARSAQKGFEYGQRLLRPELIEVYKYTRPDSEQ